MVFTIYTTNVPYPRNFSSFFFYLTALELLSHYSALVWTLTWLSCLKKNRMLTGQWNSARGKQQFFMREHTLHALFWRFLITSDRVASVGSLRPQKKKFWLTKLMLHFLKPLVQQELKHWKKLWTWARVALFWLKVDEVFVLYHWELQSSSTTSTCLPYKDGVLLTSLYCL